MLLFVNVPWLGFFFVPFCGRSMLRIFFLCPRLFYVAERSFYQLFMRSYFLLYFYFVLCYFLILFVRLRQGFLHWVCSLFKSSRLDLKGTKAPQVLKGNLLVLVRWNKSCHFLKGHARLLPLLLLLQNPMTEGRDFADVGARYGKSWGCLNINNT